MAESPITLKLLVDTKGQRVLFAEAGKDCVDFLFYILSLPVATVTSLLKNQKTVGSLVNLFNSVEKLNDCYVQPDQKKDTLLKPVSFAAQGSSIPLLLLNGTAAPALGKKFYTCGSRPNGYSSYGYHYAVSDDPRAVCPTCKLPMSTDVQFVASPFNKQKATSSSEGGFVKGVVTYMVMDDLSVMPMSTISSITMLNKFGITDVRLLEEKEVKLGMDEAVKLLNACLQSKAVLTDVFLKKYPSI